MSTAVLKIAVCLFPDVAALDYQGPMELIGFLSQTALERRTLTSPYIIEATYLAHTLDPVKPMAGPLILPDRVYGEVKDDEQFDIILIPGGLGTRPNVIQPSLLEFAKKQVPGAKYVLTVCTGSWVLAQAGLLNGKRATTNKAMFNTIKEATKEQPITWVPKARWVVDGNFWTSSGITAGTDMANAFLEYLVGPELTSTFRAVAELSARNQDDDEFAAVHGLV